MTSSEIRFYEAINCLGRRGLSGSFDKAPEKRCYFMGISLMSTHFFSKAVVSAYLQHFDANKFPFIILIADSLEANNYQYFYGLSKDEANRKSKRNGENYLSGYQKTARNFRQCFIVLTSDLESDIRYRKAVDFVFEHYLKQGSFRKLIKAEVEKNLGHYAFNRLAKEEAVQNPSLLDRYVIGEVAITLYLHQISAYTNLHQVSKCENSILANLSQQKQLLSELDVSLDCRNYVYWHPAGDQRAAA